MNKQLILLVFLISCMFSAKAQVEVSGQVKDAQTKNPLEFCSISVFNAKDSLITGTVTDEKGFFTLPVKRGNYHLLISFIGYKTDTSKTIEITANKFLGTFKLEQDVKNLKEVSVKANSSENQLDRDVQVVTDKMKSGASSAKEVLEKVNGVSYDRFNNSVKVDNNDKVIILVDGMEKDQEYIKNLSPERLKKIEVIRDPGGRYALEGYSAVINIMLKKDYQGTEIYISDRSMIDLDAVKDEYIPVQNNLNATVNYVYNKLNLYASYANNVNNFNLQSTSKKEYYNSLLIEKTFAGKNDMNTKVKQLYNYYTLGADYQVNPKHTISFEGNISGQPQAFNRTGETFDVAFSSNGVVTDKYKIETKNVSGNTSLYNSVFYEGRFDENNTLKTNFTYSVYDNKYHNTYLENSYESRIEEGTDSKTGTKFYLEFHHTFQNKTSIMTGYGNTWENRDNRFMADFSENRFQYRDFKHKLYAYYSWQKSKKFSIKIGGACESSSPEANGLKRTYLIYQPYADIKFKPAELYDVKLKYRSAGNYPDISQANPFTSMVDKQSERTGNPSLSPEVVHKLSLQNNILQGLVTIEPYFHYSDNMITETGSMKNDSVLQYTFHNAGNYMKYGVEARFTVPFGQSLFLKSGFDVFGNSIKFDGNTNEFTDWTMNTQFIYQNQKSELVAGLEYQKNMSRMISAQGYSKGDNDYWIVFLQQPFFKQKLEVMLLYFFPIDFGADYDQGSYIKTDKFSERITNDISLLKNMIMLQISYRFNKGKSVTKNEKNIEKDRERGSKGLF